MLQLQLRRLDLFCTVVQEGGVTRAAERLHVAQPWVSAQLRILEKAAGAPLFVRDGRRIALTEAGRRFHAWAADVLAGSAQVRRDIENLGAGLAGSLTVATSMAIGTYLVPPLLTGLRHERPGADITVHISEPAAALRSVATGDADFAVATFSDELDPEPLHAERLWEEPLVLAAAPGGPPDGDTITLAELAGLPLVGVPAGVAFDRTLGDQLRRHGAGELTYVMRLGHAEAMKRAVAANGWCCFSPSYVLTDDVDAGRLRSVTISDANLVEGIGLFHRRTKFFSPLQEAAVAMLREVATSRSGEVTAAAPPR
ncbi:LysR family transcriptional regulator [Pseudonocardia sp. EC080610-09]|uniref:LysR family transcriptional regulator n=1 Tax=unclassified Pseudonocardia TaxID=2619320 RepID=UPI0006CB180E|nr:MULTISPECIES: LysR family transcriptional regulator [unclassified Pseudonocardia]ALE74362.1 LysR family transcriptional regulator [Pseudonocardia sp. EC080625-04]ALL77769.1 LysR family transcriptional regulator [Pseudonocardia sp. EC080610-09]ALL80684.1 LysR family transcriptional regulator [Pseudonocardia sp. EC080619-01]